MTYEFMTDAVWERMKPFLPKANSFGRPRCADRDVLEGILWVLKTSARWRDIPKHLPSAATCWRRLRDIVGMSSCCHTDVNGHPISGAVPSPTPIWEPVKSNKKGDLTYCKKYLIGVAAPGYVSYLNKKGGEFHSFDHGQVIVLQSGVPKS